MKIVITPRGFASFGLNEIKIMEDRGFEVDYNNSGVAYSPDEFLQISKDADAIIVGVDIIDKDFIDQCPKLKVICKFGVGTDNIDIKYANEKNIFVGRTVGSNSNAVAEHVMALIYSESKNIYDTIYEVRAGEWNKPTGRELFGKTIGIIGFGSIGRKVAKQANGIGMKVTVYDIFDIAEEDLYEISGKKSELEHLLAESDYITLHLPLTKKTENLISKKELDIMKNTVCLINTARGGIVNENDLAEALISGSVRSACFDVYSSEPPNTKDKLFQCSNFYLTPHTGARTQESEIRTCKLSSEIVLSELEKENLYE